MCVPQTMTMVWQKNNSVLFKWPIFQIQIVEYLMCSVVKVDIENLEN